MAAINFVPGGLKNLDTTKQFVPKFSVPNRPLICLLRSQISYLLSTSSVTNLVHIGMGLLERRLSLIETKASSLIVLLENL